MHSPNLTEENIARIRDMFPGCVTEAQGEDGSVKLMVDFDQLRQELSDAIVEGPQERYHLNWPGKREALLTANAPIAKTLRPVREESVDFDTTKNLFIEGDNLDALKLLQETYLGKVKMIYIDPPYNTGNDFIYEDDFSEEVAAYFRRSNQVDEEGNRLIANTLANGRFHSDWLSMVYPRLKIGRNLLAEDGVLFVSADYHESANLRKICDEIFGEQNFQADISWQKRYTRSNNTQDFTTVVEHILVYSQSDAFRVNLLPRTDEADGRYSNPDNDTRGPWKGASFLNPATPEQRPNLCYPIKNPNTGQTTTPTTNAWRRSKDEFERLQNEGLLYWGSNGDAAIPSIKMFLSEARGLTPINFWDHAYAGNTDDGTRDVSSLFGSKVFDNPKPVQLMKRILEHATTQDSIVLDFFAGSGSMAHAVLEPVYDLIIIPYDTWMKRTKYASDISKEKFAEIEPLLRSVRRSTKPTTIDLYEVFCAVLYLLRTGCQWRFLPGEFPKWQSVYAYWRKWNEPDQHGVSVLEQALKKSGWRGPRETGAQRLQHVLDCGRAKREEYRHG
ncbi:hypothetical protein Nstercoris_00271 [Nitrosomonas stercoris]|uniref:site-specific DNA-methyltransferase (adenine-specific) n=2 Tax=Nitrosomonas stercoris TaxID=1444684 RepID=A0A4Y1YIX5_9PROT|nr:hypothetical protein Nstercoris_00271 [Nitrosomonas stercoris]